MRKICQPSPPVRRRRAIKKAPDHETSKLEEKLDGLVTLLKSATQGGQGIINTTLSHPAFEGMVAPNRESSSGPVTSLSSEIVDEGYAHVSLPHMPSHSESQYTTTSSSPKSTPQTSLSVHSGIDYAVEPSLEEAELCLNKFRNDFAIQLPFIVISPSVTAQQLRLDRPMLWFTIVAVTSTNSAQQIARSKQTKAMIAKEAVTEGVRNMDLLLSILVYSAWYVPTICFFLSVVHEDP